jgi:crotonobetainyl-CoA:carnitine CoA-transferase CaiB-like acyl-CoA transferase
MLSPYRILDLTDEKGLICGQLLGSLGAEVIKVEHPGGDQAREIGPFFHDIDDPEKSLFWFAFNTNKKGITLDIESSRGKKIFTRLVAQSDVIIQSFTPGYLDKIGLKYSTLEKLNPGIILTSITPFGQEGPYKYYKASDLVCWAMGGALFMCGSTGEAPVRVSHVPQAFIQGSLDGAWSTAMALYWRGISGKGQQIDISIQESVERCALTSHVTWKLTGRSYLHQDSNYAVYPLRPDAPPATWKTKDGYIRYTIYTGEQGARMNRPVIEWMASEGLADEYLSSLDWSHLSWDDLTLEEKKKIAGYFSRFFMRKTKTEILEKAMERKADVEPVYSVGEVLEHPQFQDRDYFQVLEHPELGQTISYPGGFSRFSGISCRQYRRAPLIGEHNLEIYHGLLGIATEDLLDLKKSGVI